MLPPFGDGGRVLRHRVGDDGDSGHMPMVVMSVVVVVVVVIVYILAQGRDKGDG